MAAFSDPDSAAWADDDLIAEIASRPNDMAVMLDQMLVERGGLKTFIELAWPQCEGDEYFSNWHIDAICEHLEAVSRGEIKRLAICCPPRHMKTISVSVMWPAWDWILNPQRRFIFASYAYGPIADAAVKSRNVITSDWFRQRWGHVFSLSTDNNQKSNFTNNKGGARISASVTGQLTGKGASFLCVDDPHNVIEGESDAVREKTVKWYKESTQSRLNDPRTGAFILIQQRVHARDVVGSILNVRGAKPYTVLCLPAEYERDHPLIWARDPRKEEGQLLWPARIGPTEVAEFKAALGEYAWAGQYQQRPSAREGGIFKRVWFKVEKAPPADCEWARAWDFAATEKQLVKSDPDYSATALIGFSRSAGKWYVKEVLRWRVEPNQVRALVLSMANVDGKLSKQTIPKDPSQSGKDQAQEYLSLLAGWDVQAEPQTGSKMQRAMPFAAQASGGNVVLIEGPWNEDFLVEITGFPTGAHDDQVDAAASAFNRLTGGHTGLLDYYRAKVEALASNAPAPLPVGIVSTETTSTDLTKSYFGIKPAQSR